MSTQRTLLALMFTLLGLPDCALAVTALYQSDFTWGTYIIDQPGRYRLAEDIEFQPNSPATLAAAIADGRISTELAERLGLPVAPQPVPAAAAGVPLATQFKRSQDNLFSSAGPLVASYDPAAFGLGFFAAIVIAADNVELDLAGHSIAQSAEHALLQRFFSVIELAEQPFIPRQGPADFGENITSANNVLIKNGRIGRSSHHGIHGNGNRNVVVANIEFDGYEVAALALNGVQGLMVVNATASNRKDVPVLGTFSAAQFIRPYLVDMLRRDVSTTLNVHGRTITVVMALTALNTAINRVHADVLGGVGIDAVTATIDPVAHPGEYALFHNPHGLVDGNSYSFLVNQAGVAVNGFPLQPASGGSKLVIFDNVHVRDQQAVINEIVALNAQGGAATDPVGSVWQIHNRHPDSGEPVTLSDFGPDARYTGNPLANAQALVAKAIHAGAFAGSHLDVERNSISPSMVRWVERADGFATLAQLLADTGGYRCNGDSMFHVNKGAIAFRLDGTSHAWLRNTSVIGLRNGGRVGSTLCGDYLQSVSHPAATLRGYGGARVRGYSFAGSRNISIRHSVVRNLVAQAGDATAIDILTDSEQLRLQAVRVESVSAGLSGLDTYVSPNNQPSAAAIRVAAQARRIRLHNVCSQALWGYAGSQALMDASHAARASGGCRR